MPAEKVIGIDFGTSYSCVAVMDAGKPTVIVNAEGSRITPSVAAFSRSGESIVGQMAKRQSVTNAPRTFQSIKRALGTDFRVSVDGTEYSPAQLSAMILQKLKEDAEAYLGEPVTKAVIAIPAYFDDAQRQATRDAGQLAGLEVLRLINEPTASALAYGFDKSPGKQNIVVYDLGGGTFDVSVLQIDGDRLEVKATSGNNHLGGDDFDQVLVEWIKSDFQQSNGLDVSSDLMALQRVKEAAEKVKVDLSTTMISQVHVPFIMADTRGPQHLELSITRAKFNELTADLVASTMAPVEQVMKDAGLSPADIDRLLLVGGCTRIPAVQEAINRFFGKEPEKSINPDEAVALGAAIQASMLAGETKEVMLLDVTPLSLGVESAGGLFTKLIEKNTTIPTSRSMLFSTAVDEQTKVEIHVLQGERSLCKYNRSLARLYLEGLPRRPRGALRIEITFDIDADGIVHVTAKDSDSGIQHTIAIERTGGLSREETEKLEREAEEFADKDEHAKEVINARIKGQTLAIEADRSLSRYEGVVSASCLNAVRAALSRANKALADREEGADLTSAVEALDRALMDLGKAIYSGGNIDDDSRRRRK